MKLHSSWKNYLGDELEKDYFKTLNDFLVEERKNKTIFPQEEDVFNAFEFTHFDNVKVVVLGQDPYHGEGQAHGLSFSVQKGVKVPPSLKNIYKEIESDLDCEIPEHGYLEKWARQGVLLLNNTLTVEKSKAGSHQKKGWEKFTDRVVEVLNSEKEGLVFLLWGSPAQKKGKNIDQEKHYVLQSPHPSPLSAYRGFFGCKHFSMTNEYLKKTGKESIDWSLNDS